MEYLAPDIKNKVILVTSFIGSEGKTFTAINLSTILAKAGKRTVLLELDLHKPRIQKVMDMNNDVGISSILIGKADYKDAIKHTLIENLDVILSGPLPPNASELILTPQLAKLFNDL